MFFNLYENSCPCPHYICQKDQLMPPLPHQKLTARRRNRSLPPKTPWPAPPGLFYIYRRDLNELGQPPDGEPSLQPPRLRGRLRPVPGYKDLVWYRETPRASLRLLARTRPALVLFSLASVGPSELNLIKRLHTRHPTLKLLVVCETCSPKAAAQALAAGADGYVLKTEKPRDVAGAIRDVLAGMLYLSEDLLAVRTD
jgi:CheY-like chemotaxis protein